MQFHASDTPPFPKRRAAIAFAVLLALATGIANAGAILRVGPTRPFLNIQAAINAAVNGDLILVDAGTYPGFVIPNKGVSVLSDTATPFTVLPSGTVPVVIVVGLQAGQSVTVMGFNTTVPFGGASPVLVLGCQGSVRIKDAVITPTANLPNVNMRSVIEIGASASVWLSDVQVTSPTPFSGTTINSLSAPAGPDQGISAVVADNSNVQLQRTVLRGYDNLGSPSTGRYAGDALRLIGASVARIDDAPTLLTGGTGGQFGGSAIHSIGTPASTDVLANGVQPNAYVKGGGPSPGGYFAVNWDRGIVQQTPFLIERYVAVGLYSAFGTVITTNRMKLNTVHNFTVASFFGRSYYFYLGPTLFRSVVIPGAQNTAYLDYTSPLTVLASSGTLPGGTPVVNLPFPVPNVPSAVGLQLGAQAVLGPPTGQTVPQLSFTLGEILVVVP